MIRPFVHSSWLLASMLLFSAAAHAGVSAEVYYGLASAPWHYTDAADITRSKSMKGKELGAGLAFLPFKKAPVAIGLMVSTLNYDTSSLNKQAISDTSGSSAFDIAATGKYAGMVYGPEIKAWIPWRFVRPFARIGYTLGNYTEDAAITATAPAGQDQSFNTTVADAAKYNASGVQYGAGLMVTPWPWLGAFLEYHRASETHKMSSLAETVNGTKQAVDLSTVPGGLKTQTHAATSLRFGLRISLGSGH